MKVEGRNDTAQFLLSSLSVGGQMPQSSAQSAAEEVGMLFSQKAESSSKALAQRVLRTVDNRVQKVEGIQQLSELYEQLGHPGQLSLGLLTRHVRLALASDSGVEALLALTGDDPARTSVVLQYMVAQARAQGREGDIERQAVRTLYYSSVVRKQSLPSIIQALLALFDEERVNDGLRVMARALADDIAAHRPSVPSIRLRTLLSGLQGCTQLSSLLHSCRWFIERLSSRERQAELSPVSLLQRLLGYAGTGIDSDEVQSLSRELGGENLSSQLVLLNQVYPLIQRLPLAVWSDRASRQDALQSFLSLMGEHTQSEGIVQLSAGLTRPIR